MDDAERDDDADGEDVGNNADVAVDKSAAIGDEEVDVVADKSAVLDALGANESGCQRIHSLLTQK
jgi:hypothetical protein